MLRESGRGLSASGYLLIRCWLIGLLLLPLQASAQSEKGAEGNTQVSALVSSALVEARIEELKAADNGEGSDRSSLELYRSALNQLKSSDRDEGAAAAFKAQIDNAGAEKGRLDRKLKEAGRDRLSPDWVSNQLGLDELEKRLDQELAEQKLIESHIADLNVLLSIERTRPEQTAQQAFDANRKLQEIEKRLKTLESDKTSGSEARRIEQLATQQALRSLVNRLEMERLSSVPRLERLRLEIELAKLQLQQANERTQQLQKLLSEKRSVDAAKARREAVAVKREASGKHKLIQAAAETNALLGRQLDELTVDLKETLADLELTLASQQRVQRSFERARQQLELPSFGESMRELLLSHRKTVPSVRKLQKRLKQTEHDLADARVAIFRTEDQRQQLQDDVFALDRDPTIRPEGLDEAQWRALKTELTQLQHARKDMLDRLQATYGRYEKALTDLEVARGKLISEAEAYANLLERSLVWMPSAAVLNLDAVRGLPVAVKRLTEWAPITGKLSVYTRKLLDQPGRLSLLLLLFLLLMAGRVRMRRSLAEMAPAVGNVTSDRFEYTFKALLITLSLALPWVLLMFGVSLLLQQGSGSETDRFSQSLHWFTILFALLQVWRYLFIRNGLAQIHFRWNQALNMRMRTGLRWLGLVSVPPTIVLLIISLLGDDSLREGLGRLVSLLWLVAALWLAHRMLRPANSTPEQRRWWRLPLYLVTLGALLAQLFLQYQGYIYTSARLIYLLLLSGLAAMMALLLFNLSVRWLLITERRLALVRARAKRLAVQEAKAAKEAAEAAGESIHEAPEIEEINLATVSEQTRRMLRLAWSLVLVVLFFLIWSQLTPAISRLDEIVLWERVIASSTGDQLVPVSVWDLGLNLSVVVLMLAAGKNLPGLLEIAVLQRLGLDRGVNYAITKTTSYLIYGVGTILAFSMIGVGWSDIQWLVAAMGVGLGFGLQEVFANFISGLIILFERPIRIGDTVTIGDISGNVTRIRMRATTITDWDNKELIVPNKSFVTDPLINWTLSDETTRVVIRIGIAYGSDTKRAHALMARVARSHPDVLTEPAPTVFFLGFGESSLDFEVRCFVAERIKRMPLTHDLHMMLEQALRDADIEIPFPQRDLHLRSAEPGLFGQTP